MQRLLVSTPMAGGVRIGCSDNDIHGHAIHDAQTLKSMVGQLRR